MITQVIKRPALNKCCRRNRDKERPDGYKMKTEKKSWGHTEDFGVCGTRFIDISEKNAQTMGFCWQYIILPTIENENQVHIDNALRLLSVKEDKRGGVYCHCWAKVGLG